MNACHILTPCAMDEVHEEAVCIEWSDRSNEFGDSFQTNIECLISRKLVCIHFSTPETLTVQTHIPVGEIVDDESLNKTSCTGWLIIIEAFLHVLHQGVEFGEYPSVDFRALSEWHVRLRVIESIHIGIHREERVCLEELTKECTAHFCHSFLVEAEVVPRLGVGNHVPAHSIGSIFLNAFEWIHTVSKTLRHLQSVLVEHESVGNYCLEGNGIKYHCSDGMEREEPSTSLVHAFSDKVGRKDCAIVKCFLVLEWIVNLSVRHGT